MDNNSTEENNCHLNISVLGKTGSGKTGSSFGMGSGQLIFVILYSATIVKLLTKRFIGEYSSFIGDLNLYSGDLYQWVTIFQFR